MPDKVKANKTKHTDDSTPVKKEFFTVEMPGSADMRSNYRQTVRKGGK